MSIIDVIEWQVVEIYMLTGIAGLGAARRSVGGCVSGDICRDGSLRRGEDRGPDVA
jgi:hypothetical protein